MIVIVAVSGIVAVSTIVGLLWAYEVSQRREEWWRK